MLKEIAIDVIRHSLRMFPRLLLTIFQFESQHASIKELIPQLMDQRKIIDLGIVLKLLGIYCVLMFLTKYDALI